MHEIFGTTYKCIKQTKINQLHQLFNVFVHSTQKQDLVKCYNIQFPFKFLCFWGFVFVNKITLLTAY